MSESEIRKFYKGKSIFCTGGTGFLGKVLIEKLLRDCTDLSVVYILIRSKKGINPEDRLNNYINHVVFDKIRASNPQQLKKIRLVGGDVAKDSLALSVNDTKELTENVNIVFHCAANIRFDLTLKEAFNFNVNGTHRVLCLAEKMKNLEVFVHVSTAYCHCQEEVLEEKFYATDMDVYELLEMTKTMSDKELKKITPKLLKTLPNTYTLSKGYGEVLVHEFQEKFPIVIARPPIITAAWKEPIPGFVEGLTGITGTIFATGTGALRKFYCIPKNELEIMPVDVNVNAFIALAHKRSLIKNNDILYCNVTNSGTNPITLGKMFEIGIQLVLKYPTSGFPIWYPNVTLCTNIYLDMILAILFHYIPAYFIDGLLIVTGHTPILVNVHKRISNGIKVVNYYIIRNWTFKNDNLKKLYSEMNETDKKVFFVDIGKINFRDYIRDYMLGVRTFVCKEKLEDLPKDRKKMRRLYLVDKLVKILFFSLIMYCLYKYAGKSFDLIF